MAQKSVTGSYSKHHADVKAEFCYSICKTVTKHRDLFDERGLSHFEKFV